jgi:hypothetical protein
MAFFCYFSTLIELAQIHTLVASLSITQRNKNISDKCEKLVTLNNELREQVLKNKGLTLLDAGMHQQTERT